jgi:Protein of unknown function (DUF4238)
MAKQITKNQHFVPQTYLKNFSFKKENRKFEIKAIPIIDLSEGAIFPRNIESICWKKHLYTLSNGNNVDEKMCLENFYGKAFEDKYNQMYSILIDPSKKILTDEERQLIIATAITMLYRNPIWFKKNIDEIKTIFEMCLNFSDQAGQGNVEIEGNTYSIIGKTVETLLSEYNKNEKINKSLNVETQLKVAFQLTAIRLKSDNIYILKLEDESQEFITSDNPVLLQNPYRSELIPMDPKNIIKLPLDNKHYLMLMPNQNKVNLNTISRHNVKGGFSQREELNLNNEQLQNSNEYILGNSASLSRYLKMKDEVVILSREEKEFELKLIELGKQKGWI